MRKLLLAITVIVSSLAFGQTTTVYNGTVRDLTNTVVTSGQVTFTLKPSLSTTLSGTSLFSPLTVTCTITVAGAVKALDGTSNCTVVNNTSLTPTGTSYLVCLQPYFVTPGSCLYTYALGTTTDLSTVVPTPTTSPAFTFVDLYSAQTISGNKTFTGSTAFSGSLTFGALLASSVGVNALGTATNSSNFNSGSQSFVGSVWNGSIAIPDTWSWTNVLGSGANGTSTLTAAHSGSSGTSAVSVPNLNVSGNLASGPIGSTLLLRDCRLDGVVGNGSTDDSTAMNLCITNAIANHQSIINLPCASIVLTAHGWNLTNINLGQSGLTIQGCGTANHLVNNATYVQGTTQIVCSTGTSKACIDETGSSNITMRDLEANSSQSVTPSGVIMLKSRDNATNSLGSGSGNPYCNPNYNREENVDMFTAHSTTINSNFGYIAYYNVGAQENWMVINSRRVADTGVWFSSANDLSFASEYQTIITGCAVSATLATFINDGQGMQSSTGVGFEFRNVRAIHMINQATAPIGAATGYPIEFGDTAGDSNVFIDGGQFESANTPAALIITKANLDHLRINTVVNGTSGSTNGYVQFSANNIVISNSDLRVNCTVGTCQPLVSNAATGTVISGSTLDISNTVSPASFSSMTLANDVIRANGYTDANVTIPSSASGTILQTNDGMSLYGRQRSSSGTSAAPARTWAGDSATGFHQASSGNETWSSGGVQQFFNAAALERQISSRVRGWTSSTTDVEGTQNDTTYCRAAAGVFEVGATADTCGANGTVRASIMQLTANISWTSGSGVPAGGTCTASNGGSLYSRTDGTTTTTLYVCDNSTHVWTAK